MFKPRLTMMFAAFAMSAGAQAQVEIGEPWVRGTVVQQKATGAFMKLTSATGARLVGASSPVAGVTEIHEMAMDKNVMRMRQIPALDLPAGKAVELRPGGYHVMLMDLKQTLNAGDTVPITLIFEDANKARQTIEIKAAVRPLNTPAPKSQHHHH